jgi:hypothetical protein
MLHRNHIDQHMVAIVCSARSGSTKDLGTTNLLLRASSEALQQQSKTAGTLGTTTPVTRSLFSAGGTGSDGSQSPPTSPQSRSRSPGSTSPLFGFTPSTQIPNAQIRSPNFMPLWISYSRSTSTPHGRPFAIQKYSWSFRRRLTRTANGFEATSTQQRYVWSTPFNVAVI